MPKHSHRFLDEYDGLVGFGFDRQVNEYTLTYYLQKFSDDRHMECIRRRMSDSDMEEIFNLLGKLMKKYLTDDEYHSLFLKDNGPPVSSQ